MFIKIIVIVIVIVLLIKLFYKRKENFNDKSGQFCYECSGKSYNQCFGCFNCGWCVDEWGNGKCIGGDVNSGPYNKEKCAMWKTNDPFAEMKYNNAHYKMSYGPKQANRVIGINPCCNK